MKRILQLIFASVFIVFSQFFFVTPVHADNDSDNTPICTINVNGVNLPNTGDGPIVPQASRDPDSVTTAIWPISVSLNAAAQALLDNCQGAGLIAATQTGGFQGWQEFVLSGSGTSYSGTFRLNVGNIGTAHNAPIDVEVDPNNRGQCAAYEPICRRVYLKYDFTRTENEDLNCQQEMSALFSSFSSAPDRVENGQTWSASVTLSEAVKDACNVDRIRYVVTRNTETAPLVQGESAAQLQMSYPTTFVGNFRATLSTQRLSNCSAGGFCSYENVESSTKSFCVYASGTESCTPLPDDSGSTGEPITTFSICRQIPVMSQGQINALIGRIQDPEEAARLRSEMEGRVSNQRREKARCCLCTFGTEVFNAETGACSGEDGTDIIGQRRNFKPGLYTAVGCIGIDQESIITRMVRIGLGIAGGVALLMILAGAFMFSTSQGEPKRAGEAKELITSAVIGLLFIIFSVTILQFIGVTILRIPGFGG